MAGAKLEGVTGAEKFNRIRPLTNISFNIVFVILAAVAVLPVLFVLAISLTAESSLAESGYQLFPKVFAVESYTFLFKQHELILRALGISIFVTVVGTIVGVLLITTMGYVLSRKTHRLNGFLTWLVFIPMVFNGGMVSSYFINTQLFGLKNTVWALILPLAVSSFYVVIARTFFTATIPDSLVESAKIDGATQLKIYFRIVLPISLPVLATIGLFLCFAYWNDWFQAMLYIDQTKMNSMQALLTKIMENIEYLSRNATALGISASEAARTMPKEGARMAIAVLIVLPIACAYPFFQKYFISGLTVGAVKG